MSGGFTLSPASRELPLKGKPDRLPLEGKVAATGGRMRWKSSSILPILLGALLMTATLFSLCAGASGLSLMEAILQDGAARRILLYIRLPRTAAAILSGAALACAGAIIQGVLGNPLAGPNIIGVNAGAGFITLLASWLFPMSTGMLPMASFAGAFLTSLLILLLVQRTNASRLTVVLAGVAVSAILSAGTDLITTIEPEVTLGLTAFRIGGFSGVSAGRVYGAAGYILPGLICAGLLSKRLDVLCLGDEVAQSVGMKVKSTRTVLLLLASLLAGAAVSFSGLVGFVGLMSPHMVRRITGSDHKRLLPLSMLTGACMMLICDTIARTAFSPYELPVGILLSVIGGPFFLLMLLRGGRAHD